MSIEYILSRDHLTVVTCVVVKEFGRLVFDATMRKLDPDWPDGMGPNTRVADAFRKCTIMPTCPEFLMRVQTLIAEAGDKVKIVGGTIDIRKFCRPVPVSPRVCPRRYLNFAQMPADRVYSGFAERNTDGEPRFWRFTVCTWPSAHLQSTGGGSTHCQPGHACLEWRHTRACVQPSPSARARFHLLYFFFLLTTGTGGAFPRPAWDQYTLITSLRRREP